MKVIELTINDRKVSAEAGISILEAARQAGIYIPSLCYHPSVPSSNLMPDKFIYQGGKRIHNEQALDADANCNLCLVQVHGRGAIVKACETPVEAGMVVTTENDEIKKKRKESLTSILAHHPNICLTCDRDPRCPPFGVCSRSANVPDRCVACPGYATCELIRIVGHIGMVGITIPREPVDASLIDDNPFLDFDPKLCVGCTRCIRFCKEVRGIGALGYVSKEGRIITGTKAPSFQESGCHFCFGCVEVCPTGALADKKTKWNEKKEGEERKKDVVPCMAACPLQIDIPAYLYAVTKKNYDDALEIIQEKLPFASLCGHVCTHPCESACRRNELDQPVAIKAIKRFVAETVPFVETPSKAVSDKKVAVVGSGPAGMTAAYFLRKKGGHQVTVFEAFSEAGGMPLTGIPRFRLPKTVLNLELERLRRIGVEIITNQPVESVSDLFKSGFNAVLISIGAHEEIFLGIPGEENPGIMGAIGLLRKVNSGEKVDLGDRVAIIGGGNVAFDAARVSKRLGAKEVTIVYRRSEEEMPADAEEVKQAADEGINYMYLASPIRYELNGKKIRVECIRNKLKRPDASGRPRPKPVKGSEFSFEVDRVITAIGQNTRMLQELHTDMDVNGRFKVEENTLMMNTDGVFAAGDAVSGPKTVTTAIAMGAKAANTINTYLGGQMIVDLATFNPENLPQQLEQDDKFLAKRMPMPLRPVENRKNNFEQVELGLTEEMAVAEAKRCLRCSLRLGIE
ncbi:FAD-dependent oxidoreductase [Desulfosarcina ovata]|nr:FAD-dependent oxidoreductase [Desulfosarcina ovata]